MLHYLIYLLFIGSSKKVMSLDKYLEKNSFSSGFISKNAIFIIQPLINEFMYFNKKKENKTN